MPMGIKESRRHRHLVQADWIKSLGGYKAVASACMCSPVNVSKWMEDPSRSGQDIPLRHLQTMLALTGADLVNLPAQNYADEWVQDNLLNLYFRRAVPEEVLFDVIGKLQGQQIGKAVNG